jgi:hypothetical protein
MRNRDTAAKGKELQCGVLMTIQEKNLLMSIAQSLDVPYYIILRRLVRYILDEKITWEELFGKKNGLVNEEYDETKKVAVRTQLTIDAYVAFVQLAEEWGSTTSIILKRLILLYLNGKIERHAIWY